MATASQPNTAAKPPKSILKRSTARSTVSSTPREGGIVSTEDNILTIPSEFHTIRPPLKVVSTEPAPSNNTRAVGTSSKEERDLATALYHANLIQQRKDIELQILFSTETLIDLPSGSPPRPASSPSPKDAALFKELLVPFQPHDYDALIVERNINERCGYVLCGLPRVKDGGKGEFRLVGKTGRAKDFRILRREETERWCSEDCARRAMFVRVQLSERPAWEREPGVGMGSIDLLDEAEAEDGLVEGVRNMDLGEKMEGIQDQKDLALERGEQGNRTSAKGGFVGVDIVEKDITKPADFPSLGDKTLGNQDSSHLALEGYTANFGNQKQKERSGEFDFDLAYSVGDDREDE